MKPFSYDKRLSRLLTIEGWITHDGVFLSAFRIDEGPTHSDVAKWALENPDGEALADRLGWVRISDYGNRTSKPLNQKQRNVFFDWCQEHRLDYREQLKEIQIS